MPRRRDTARLPRRYDHGLPIWRPNLAPLAAVWLVAAGLCMGVYVDPPHALLVDLPTPVPDGFVGVLTPGEDVLSLEAEGVLRWNGQAIAESELAAILAARHHSARRAALMFRPAHDVPYGEALELLALLHAGDAIDGCFRFSEIHRYADYENPPDPDRLIAPDYRECDLPAP